MSIYKQLPNRMCQNQQDRLGQLPALLILVIALHFTPFPVAADSSRVLIDEALVVALQKGGYNLYFRHEATDWSQSDSIHKVGDWLSCDSARVRQLSNAGRKNAKATGEAIRSLGIPIAKVFSSPYCRTVETARLMGLGKVEPTTDVMNLRVADYFGGIPAIAATAKKLLATQPAHGTNTLIVAHGNVAREVTPVSPGEGEGIVLQPDGKGGYSFTGRLTAADWVRLSNTELR